MLNFFFFSVIRMLFITCELRW